jgi:hypothetical protein
VGGRSHNRVSIDRAIKAFTAEFEEHAARNTQKKYRILLAKLKSFSHGSFGTCDLPQTCLKFYGLTRLSPYRSYQLELRINFSSR